MQDTTASFANFPSGAKRSEKIKPRYDLIPSAPLRRLAERYALGADKYGEWNWQRGLSDPQFLKDGFNHIIDHLQKAKDSFLLGLQNSLDDDLAGAAWGCFMLMQAQEEAKNERNQQRQGSTRQDVSFVSSGLSSDSPENMPKMRQDPRAGLDKPSHGY